QADHSGRGGALSRGQVGDRLGRRQRGARVVEHFLAERGRARRTVAMEDLRPDGAFQRSDSMGHRRLRETERGGARAEPALIDDGHERAELSDVYPMSNSHVLAKRTHWTYCAGCPKLAP